MRRYRKPHPLWLLAILGWMLGVAGVQAQGAPDDPRAAGRRLMEQVNQRSLGGTARMVLELRLRDSRRPDHGKRVALERRDFATGPRTLYRILEPDHEAGILLLLAEDRPRPGMWMYFPLSDHRVPVVTRGLSALATDFSCEDLLQRFHLDEYRFRLLASDEVDGRPAQRVEMVPASEGLRRQLGYSRAIGWVDQESHLIVRADYFDQEGEWIKTYRAREVKQIDGVWTPTRYSMHNRRVDHRTDVEVVEVRYGVPLAAERFDPEALSSELFEPAEGR